MPSMIWRSSPPRRRLQALTGAVRLDAICKQSLIRRPVGITGRIRRSGLPPAGFVGLGSGQLDQLLTFSFGVDALVTERIGLDDLVIG